MNEDKPLPMWIRQHISAKAMAYRAAGQEDKENAALEILGSLVFCSTESMRPLVEALDQSESTGGHHWR